MRYALAALAALFAASSATAQGLPTQKYLPAPLAIEMASVAMASCMNSSYKVTVTIVDASGMIKLQMRGDGSNPHTIENSFRKAYTSMTTRAPSATLVTRTEANPAVSAFRHLSNMIALAGALPIMAGQDVLGAIGVSGAPGGDKDEVCAKAGIDKVADRLN